MTGYLVLLCFKLHLLPPLQKDIMLLGVNMRKINLKNIVWKEGKYYVSQCLNVEVSSFGKTKKEALDNLNEALELYFEEVKIPKIVEIQRPEVVNFPLCYA